MAAITLREYVREIEKQVDGNRNEEAIAHSRHVLESFPKHVDVYRLLGKAYLESQRFGDAGDIFQRVLSAVPEDFVSHVGMSIIREDEGNLDEAIWHMERAFDVQPSNSAIQEELRRLYGRRDNIEPPKIRLTRGALARMYFKGELYTQAIAEVRAALNENSDRFDLQALLAEIYARAGQRAEAVDMASQVLRRLPFCLAANQIMVDMLIGTERESEIQTYYQRLSQLDPYAAHVTAATPRAENVPDQAIRLSKLDYKASQTLEGSPSQPIWAATLGIEVAELATGREESLPEWLSSGPPPILVEQSEGTESASVPAFASDETPPAGEEQGELIAAPSEEEQIPDWMKDLGWGPGSTESQDAEAAMQLDEELGAPAAEGELAAAEIPDWLKAMAPAEAQTEAKSEEDVSPWLDQLFSSEPQAGEVEEAQQPYMEAKGETPDWLEAGLMLGAAAAGAAILGQDDEKSENAETLEMETASLDEALLAEALPEAQPAEGIPAWLLEDLGTAAEEISEAPSELAAEPAPDWLAEITSAGEIPGDETAEELPDWLRESLAPLAEPTSEHAQPEGEMLGWTLEETTLAEAASGDEATAQAEAELAEELPGWLFENDAVPAAEAPAEEKAEMAEELPGWLFDAAPTEAGEAAEEGLAESAEEAEGIPEWLKAAGAVAGTAAAFEVSEWLSEEETPEGEAVLASADLQAEIETDEGLLDEELPEWLRAPVETAEPVAEMELEPAEELPAEELPEWLRPMDEIAEPAAEEPAMAELAFLAAAEAALLAEEGQGEAGAVQLGDTQPTHLGAAAPAPAESPELEDAFAWLNSMLTPVEETAAAVEEPAPSEAESPAAPAAPSAEFPMDEDAAFAWMESLAVRQGAQEALLLKPEDRLEAPPDWVQQAAAEASVFTPGEAAEMIDETPAAETEAAAAPLVQASEEMPMDEDAAFAWMESLAVRQGAQEALLLKPEERRETPPDWLKAAAVVGAADLMMDKIGKEEAAAEQEQALETPSAEAVEEAAAEPAAPVPPATVEEPPELPDWLAAPSGETREETLEWTPPPLSRRKYDLNKITLVEMERLPGIGFIMAQRVIDYRNTHGWFKQIDDLLNVPEFNVATLEGVRENLYLEVPQEPQPTGGRVPTQPRPGTGPLVLATGAGLPKEVVKAREQLSGGYLELALDIYDELIRSKKHLTWVVEDLSEASNQYPMELYVWQSLGDAYVRSDLAGQALQAFIRAEKLLLQ